MDPHSFFADPVVLLNADPDPAAFLMRIRIKLIQNLKKIPYEELKKTKKIAQKLKSMELVQIYLILKNKITITWYRYYVPCPCIFQFFPKNVSLPDPCGLGIGEHSVSWH